MLIKEKLSNVDEIRTVGIKKIKYHYVFIFEIRSQRRIVPIGRFPLTPTTSSRNGDARIVDYVTIHQQGPWSYAFLRN